MMTPSADARWSPISCGGGKFIGVNLATPMSVAGAQFTHTHIRRRDGGSKISSRQSAVLVRKARVQNCHANTARRENIHTVMGPAAVALLTHARNGDDEGRQP